LLISLLEGAQLAARAAGHGGPLKEAAAAFVAYALAQRPQATPRKPVRSRALRRGAVVRP
jgi:hypothetical protein